MILSWGLRAELEGYCRSGLLLHQRQYVKVLTCKELYSGSSCNLFTSIYGSDTDHVCFCCFIMEQLQKNSVLHMTLDKATLFLEPMNQVVNSLLLQPTIAYPVMIGACLMICVKV